VPDAQSQLPERRRITGHEKLTLCRELATAGKTRAALAREYGISRGAMTEFAQRNAREIDAIKARLDDEFAGLWIARKAARIAEYQHDLERIADNPHHEWVKARTAILKAVAEELGQLPPRVSVAVIPAQHVLIGVDEDEAFPDLLADVDSGDVSPAAGGDDAGTGSGSGQEDPGGPGD
jgi:hypothetical protein